MYYDMQTDKLYDNEYAMEGIFGKFKEKREAKGIIKNANPEAVAKLLVSALKQYNRFTLSKSDNAKSIMHDTLKEYNDSPGKVRPTISKALNIEGYPVVLTTNTAGSFLYLSYVYEVNGKEQMDIVSAALASKLLGDKVKSLTE